MFSLGINCSINLKEKQRIPISIHRLNVSLLQQCNKRFGEIQRDIADILPKMLPQELKALELIKIIKRILFDPMPISTEYTLIPLGWSMKNLLVEILKRGVHFLHEIIRK